MPISENKMKKKTTSTMTTTTTCGATSTRQITMTKRRRPVTHPHTLCVQPGQRSRPRYIISFIPRSQRSFRRRCPGACVYNDDFSIAPPRRGSSTSSSAVCESVISTEPVLRSSSSRAGTHVRTRKTLVRAVVSRNSTERITL